MEEFLRVGVISTTHGVHGEVKVFPTTENPERFESLREVWLDTGKERLKLEIEQVRYFKQMLILKFKGYQSIDEIEKYKGKDLLIERKDAIPLEEGEYFICDVIGCNVESDKGEAFGTVKDIMQTGANDVYVVTAPDGRELLFPSIPECILEVDIEKRRVLVHVMDGLLD